MKKDKTGYMSEGMLPVTGNRLQAEGTKIVVPVKTYTSI